MVSWCACFLVSDFKQHLHHQVVILFSVPRIHDRHSSMTMASNDDNTSTSPANKTVMMLETDDNATMSTSSSGVS